jgi:murein L,D-transpeptidase YcbB/YkuD
MAMHVVVARHASVRAQGRIDPTLVHAEWNATPATLDLTALVALLQRDGTVADAAFAQLEPTTPHYRRLLLARDAVRALRADSARLALPAAARPIPIGRRTGGLRDLARLLVVLGELAPGARIDTVRYTAPVADAVLRLKRRTDKRATATLDAATITALHAALVRRDRDIALAIERWRWLPREHAVVPLVVNIPEFRLERWTEWAGDTLPGGLAMNVVVGRADSNATPVFTSRMTQVVFSPQWRLPMSIMKKEILPAALGNPGYLRKHAYYLVTARGDELPMTAANIARIGTGVWVRQRSGGGNALGRVKFNMYNPHDIYLHDTPSKRFFARARRDLSHGCVRLADPVALARYVLADAPQWTDERIADAMDGGKETFVGLRRSVPVLLVYHTFVIEPDGAHRRVDDIYGHDERTLAALRGERTVPATVTDEGAP